MDVLKVNGAYLSEVSERTKRAGQEMKDLARRLENITFQNIGNPEFLADVIHVQSTYSAFLTSTDLEGTLKGYSRALTSMGDFSTGLSGKVERILERYTYCESRLAAGEVSSRSDNPIYAEPLIGKPVEVEMEYHTLYASKVEVTETTGSLNTTSAYKPRLPLSSGDAEKVIKFLYGQNALDHRILWVFGEENNPELHEMKKLLTRDPSTWTDAEKAKIILAIKTELISNRDQYQSNIDETLEKLYKELPTHASIMTDKVKDVAKDCVRDTLKESAKFNSIGHAWEVADEANKYTNVGLGEIDMGESVTDSVKTLYKIGRSLDVVLNDSTTNYTLEQIASKEAANGLPKSSFTVNSVDISTGNSVADQMIKDNLPKTSTTVNGSADFKPDRELGDMLSDLVIQLELDLQQSR